MALNNYTIDNSSSLSEIHYEVLDYGNFTNISFEKCEKKQIFSNVRAFFFCYSYFFNKIWLVSTIQLLICFGMILFNLLVMILMVENSERITKFDQIILGHSMIDGITGVIDSLFYHVYCIFAYWPFGEEAGLMWVAYDNMQNFITCTLMSYAVYTKLRSIQNPKGFKQEFLLKNPYLIMIIIWLVGIVIWLPLTLKFHLNFDIYQTKTNTVLNYLDSFVNLVTWVGPLIVTLVVSVKTYFLLSGIEKKRNINRMNLKQSKLSTFASTTASISHVASTVDNVQSNKNKFGIFCSYFKKTYLSPRAKLGIIMGTFLLQWFPPAILRVLNPFVSYVPPDLNLVVHWMTYSVCCSNPIFVLLLNPNITCKKRFYKIKRKLF